MIDLEAVLKDFWNYVRDEKLDLYNEFSLQHELGIYLRCRFPAYKVQFERNVSFFHIWDHTIKREIDIVIYSPDMTEKYAIELKYPRNGQYPEQMYAFVKDIIFMEQLKKAGFTKAVAMTLADDRSFFEGEKNEGIYRYFRSGFELHGDVYRPTGSTKGVEHICVDGRYH